ncbi:sulfite exporter TauE/SafE family protein [Synechococcus sp. CBW1004]|uniref:sulfite exporter TauE/SafE family protein n=1 Tax=Synechococcus sp. CBW1004 TaxID=1353136 RepID=UPI001E48774A|nr:sulfite exporter TauE/SafE family protein [Synechococcus sp. CBW1004]
MPLPLLPLTLSPWLLPPLALVAFLYATVGHAGASGYIAVLALAGLPAALIKPLALLLNLVVAAQGSWQFWRAGHLRGSLLWPLLASGMPAAFLGGWLDLPTEWFQRLVALVLLASALRFLRQPRDPERLHTPPLPLLLLSGAGLGLLAGLTGTGGGVFLTPLLLLAAWATTRQAAAVSSLFILVNSFSGLMGLLLARQGIGLAPAPQLGWLLLTVLLAGGLGSRLGSRHWPVSWIRRVLALVLLLAAWKLLGFAG